MGGGGERGVSDKRCCTRCSASRHRGGYSPELIIHSTTGGRSASPWQGAKGGGLRLGSIKSNCETWRKGAETAEDGEDGEEHNGRW